MGQPLKGWRESELLSIGYILIASEFSGCVWWGNMNGGDIS